MNPSEKTLIIQLSALVDFASSLPLDMITEKNPTPSYPVTIGEHVVSYALSLTVTHDWKSPELEEIAETVETHLIQLDTGVDNPETWRKLFEANIELKKRLN